MKTTELKRGSRLTRKTPMKTGGRLPPVNRERRAKRKIANYGTTDRLVWFIHQPCVCEGKHPACTRGFSQNSHIIPQSAGCHGYIGTQGWARWEREVGELLGLEGPLDRHALAADFATRGPDAPKGEA